MEVMELQWIVEEHIARTKTERKNKMNFNTKRFSTDSLSKCEDCDSGFSDDESCHINHTNMPNVIYT